MSPMSHALVGWGFGVNLVIWRDAAPTLQALVDALPSWLIAPFSVPIPDAALGAATSVALFFGAVLGGRAPDRLEITRWKNGRCEAALIPHRTLTHSPWIWIGLLVAATALTTRAGYEIGAWWLAGFASSALLHVLLDRGSSMGIPLGNPFGKRTSLRWYRVGHASERWSLLAVLTLFSLMAVLPWRLPLVRWITSVA